MKLQAEETPNNSLVQVFSYEYCGVFKNIILPPVAATFFSSEVQKTSK